MGIPRTLALGSTNVPTAQASSIDQTSVTGPRPAYPAALAPDTPVHPQHAQPLSRKAKPYFPAKEDWTWASLLSNPPPPQESPPPFQQSNLSSRSLRPQRQNPRRKEVRFESPQVALQSQSQEHQPDDGWSLVWRRRSSPQRQ